MTAMDGGNGWQATGTGWQWGDGNGATVVMAAMAARQSRLYLIQFGIVSGRHPNPP